MHLLKVDELRQIGRLLLQLFVGTNRLLVKGEHGIGQPTHQAEALTLLGRESGAMIGQRIQ
ncbi:hypothetical protein [Streptomyces sp. BE133]|uniref:hypothetical protein n=1 Tax=Streptomyces sp. BE133 TaxID=3002523 RepID=UPI002E77C1F4|nr:hypothetical protein [Streptomyces sp. BE133]MEE1805796.1 hypothetical protein [Streptomyces sp. BE133]